MTDLLVLRPPAPVRPRCGGASGSGSWALVADLARVQAVRILRHPVFLLGLAWYVVLVGIGDRPDTPYAQYSTRHGDRSPSWWVRSPSSRPTWWPARAAGPAPTSGPPACRCPGCTGPAALLLACLAPAAFAAVLDLAVLLLIRLYGGLDMHGALAAPRQRPGHRARRRGARRRGRPAAALDRGAAGRGRRARVVQPLDHHEGPLPRLLRRLRGVDDSARHDPRRWFRATRPGTWCTCSP